MGPTNVALVKLYEADQALREAQGRLDAATRNVRIQERRTNDLAERTRLAQANLRENQARSSNLELDLKTRDAHIEKLRTQQQQAKNNKEYQAFLVEINTAKVDRGKIEDETMRVMEAVEKQQAELKDLQAHLQAEQAKLATMKAEITDRVNALQAEIDALMPQREQAAAAVPARVLQMFERLADHHDGEAMAALARPDRRREEYACTACHMDLTTDVYNRLHNRDEPVPCASCGRLLFIPDDLPPELAVNKPKEKKDKRARDVAADIGRQTSAVDVLNSMRPDEEEEETPSESPQQG